MLAQEKFILINSIIEKHNLRNMLSYLCRAAGISRSRYYNYYSLKSITTRNKQEENDLESYKNF